MGVPALFRWLSRKYPKIVQPVSEDEAVKQIGDDGKEFTIPVDTTQPNPNGTEFDCLYLDANGIVHNCTHPEGREAPATEAAMMLEIFAYTDRVVSMIRPRKVLLFAIDGVAPRAKLNQQRSRRFRAAQDAKEKEEQKQQAIAEWEATGRPVPDEWKKKAPWDSNAITPGTPFMFFLSACLKYWIAYKLNTDPGWAGLQVILSDSSVPGEGEHKIVDFVRRQRSQPGYDPNTTHVFYGLDADLIMLSLATHEPNFKILREDVFAQDKKSGCHRCGQPGHHSNNCTNPMKPPEEKKSDKPTGFIFLDVTILREYLEAELNVPNQGFPYDMERAIDDWVFLLFFVGNDFLPHLPSLEIREGAIDCLLRIWKSSLSQMGGYLTNNGKIELANAQLIVDGLSAQEDEIFRKRQEVEERQATGEKRRKIEQQRREEAQGNFVNIRSASGTALPPKPQENVANLMHSGADIVANRAKIRLANLSAAEMLKAELAGKAKPPLPASATEAEKLVAEAVPANGQSEAPVAEQPPSPQEQPRGTKRKADEADVPSTRADVDEKVIKQSIANEDDDTAPSTPAPEDPNAPGPLKKLGNNVIEQEDKVKLWEPGYKERYYRQKFGVELSDAEFRRSVVKSYVEGLSWVLAYYYQGCPSWTWYYPYHFSPFASDFTDLATLDIKLTQEQPVRPYEQLMSVLPRASKHNIPPAYHPLMMDEDSEIYDFYPEDFQIDMNGKKMAWQGVALLPFIDLQRLLDAMKKKEGDLTEDEVSRNSMGNTFVFLHEDNPLWTQVGGLYSKRRITEPEAIDPNLSKGVRGFILPDPACLPSSTYTSPLTEEGCPDIDADKSISAIYSFPEQLRPHKSQILPGIRHAARELTAYDLENVKRGSTPRSGPAGDGFHSNRRDIDGVGLGRPRGPNSHRSSDNLQNYGGYNSRGGTPGSVRSGGYDSRNNSPSPGPQRYSSYSAPQQQYNNQYSYGGGNQQPSYNQQQYQNYGQGNGYGAPQQYGQNYQQPTYGTYQSPIPPQNSYGGYGGYGQAHAPSNQSPLIPSHLRQQQPPPPPPPQNYGQQPNNGYPSQSPYANPYAAQNPYGNQNQNWR